MSAGQKPESWIRMLILLTSFLSLSPAFPPRPSLAQESTEVSANEAFMLGERLVYAIEWDPPWYFFFLPKMEAGEIEVVLSGEAEYKGKKALKILFNAHSSGSLAKLAGLQVEDEFVFFAEPETFCSYGASKKVREGKRKRQIEIEYLREKKQLLFREMDESADPPKIHRNEIRNDIPECVQDPFSAIYCFRTKNLRPDYVHKALVGHDTRIKEITCRVVKQENIHAPAGKYPAWKVEVVSLMGGLFKDGGQFRMWFSADKRKMPVQFDVKVKLGSVVGKLTSAK